MGDFCTTTSLFGHICSFLGDIQNFIVWLDQRINLNEGVIALVALLVGIGMQNVDGARRIAGLGFIGIAIVFATVAVLEGPTRTLRGQTPFAIEVPSLFHNVHGDRGNIIASDEPGRNSVQLVSGDLKMSKPGDYLAKHCNADMPAFSKEIKEENEIDDAGSIVRSFIVVPSGHVKDLCYFSWHERNQPLDHYEVYVVIPSSNGALGQFARMHLRAEKPSHALVTEDYRNMRNSLFTSAGLPIPTN